MTNQVSKIQILKKLLKGHISKKRRKLYVLNKRDYDGKKKSKIKIINIFFNNLKLSENKLFKFKLSGFDFFAPILAIEKQFAGLENC